MGKRRGRGLAGTASTLRPGRKTQQVILTRGLRNAGEGMRLGSLEAKYPEEYGGLRAERQGQQKVL